LRCVRLSVLVSIVGAAVRSRQRKCKEPGCERYFVPKSKAHNFCLQHRKHGPVEASVYRPKQRSRDW
jgi:hypothetical protein